MNIDLAIAAEHDIPHQFLPRAVGCLAGAFVLALMWGPQEGSTTDDSVAFRDAIFSPRILGFLGVGAIAFVLITFWPVVKPYLVRPGSWPLIAGTLTVLASVTLMHWNDQVGDAKFSTVATAVGQTSGISALASAFFGWLYLVQFAVVILLCGATIVTRRAIFGWIGAVVAVVAAIDGLLAHAAVVNYIGRIDKSTGAYVAVAGYAVMAAACIAAAISTEQVAHTRAFITGVLAWRPGMLLIVIGALITVFAFVRATWFSPVRLNATMMDAHNRFEGTGLNTLAVQYLIWLGWTLLVVSTGLAAFASYRQLRPVAWAATVVSAVAVLLTVVTLYDMSSVGADNHVDAATGPWQNLGVGGWEACFGLFLVGSGAFIAASTGVASADSPAAIRTPSRMSAATNSLVEYKSLALAGLAFALFYPPMATDFWQKVLVTEVGVYVLLAVGLNVVVGWAGLLDLGFIAFFAIGSYTTAYLVGALPRTPPSWLHLSPLLAIPFAIVICLIAGVCLGAPTLRLRGDYLAIVTLGFGEIIRIVANNNPSNFTNGPRGATNIPHPVIHIGPIHLVWGLDSLPYWYLLLIITIIVVVLFWRLEGSRLGRAWAAVREDEVAAQATGINTIRIKLLAFAIGASTSGVAGVFFASQVGYINPDNFVLNNSILVVAYVVFGGMGSLPGAMAGAAMLTWLPEFLKDQVPQDDRQMWIGAIVLLMMIFRPEGLIPARRRKAELGGLDRASSAETTAVPASEGM